MFRMTPLALARVDVGPEDDAQQLIARAEELAVGDLENALVVSLPQTTTSAAAMELQRKLRERFPDRLMIIVTHNVHFLMLEPMSPVQARRLLDKIQKELPAVDEEIPAALQEEADRDAAHVASLEAALGWQEHGDAACEGSYPPPSEVAAAILRGDGPAAVYPNAFVAEGEKEGGDDPHQ